MINCAKSGTELAVRKGTTRKICKNQLIFDRLDSCIEDMNINLSIIQISLKCC